MKQSVNILLSGGGTGGHIYPAVAIANELKAKYPNASFLFVGAKGKMEMEKIPNEGFKIEGLWISGLQRKLTIDNLSFPFKLLTSLYKANKIIKKFKPTVIIGTGGFASGPTLYMGNKKGIRTLIQEQNSYPGITNKLLAKKATKICVAYDNMERFFPADKIVKTGNPVRQDLLTIDGKREEAITFFKLNPAKKTLLILGGSLGARAINNLIEQNLKWLLSNNIQIIWQTGKLYYDEFKKHNVKEGIQVHAFLNKMDLTFAAADIIISRAGAGTISELCVVGKPVIFIPSPNVAEDHQTKNAMAIVNKNAGILLKENELTKFQQTFSKLLKSKDKQLKIAEELKKLALPNATKNIVLEIEKLINSKN